MDSSPNKSWYVARTRYYHHEIKIRDRLRQMDIEVFVPTVTRARTRSKALAERAVAPNLVFVHTDRKQALDLITESHLPMEWKTDCATRRMMVVPDKQMDDFRRVFKVASHEEGGLMEEPYALGDEVKVTDGVLSGVEGSILEEAGKYYVVVGLVGSIFARAMLPKAYLMKI